MEVARVDPIVVDDTDPPDAARAEREGRRAAEPARADDQDAGFHVTSSDSSYSKYASEEK